MKRLKSITSLLLTLLLITSCGVRKNQQNHKQLELISVHVLPIKDSSSTNDDLIYWYIISTNNGEYSYTYSSPTKVESFVGIEWAKVNELPAAVSIELFVKPDASMKFPVDELPEEIQAQMDTTPENFGGLSLDEMGDYESGSYESGSYESKPEPQEVENASPTEESSSNSSTDNTNSDSGSSDSGSSD